MKKIKLFLGLLLLYSINLVSYASTCPDPATSSLQWGVPPSPWVVNPYSANPSTGEENTFFIKANILVTGILGQGVVCTYYNSAGPYSIWWPVLVKVPARIDYNWIDERSGFVCTASIEECRFNVAQFE